MLISKSVPRDHLDSGISLLMESAFTPVINEHTVQEGLDNVLTDLTYMKLGCPRKLIIFFCCWHSVDSKVVLEGVWEKSEL